MSRDREARPRVEAAGVSHGVHEAPDDFLVYLGSIGGELAHMAKIRGHGFLAYLLGMLVREVDLMLEARTARIR